MNYKLPEQRWEINNPDREIINQLVQTLGVSPIIAQILFNRNLKTTEDARSYIDPESEKLPSLLAEFPDLEMSVELLKTAIQNQKKIGLCGNYTADGMTSTALLLIALKHLGADVTYVIPSQKDGYGINERIVKEFDYLLISLIITVDHGISAYEPIELARDLDIDVIITDHHDLPENLPPANAILNPKLSTENSPYRTLVGVGVAYILAVTLAQELDLLKGLTAQLLELFTLGTIADIALVNGVNRRWLKRGLKLISQSQIKGVQALMQISGISQEHQEIKADDIRNILAPRISAVGEISDPEIMIELLTTEDESIALERAMQCEQIYLKRERICEKIAQEAIEIIDNTPINWQEKRVLLIVKAGWHIGVLLIVAFRLKNRYGVPVFICTYDEENPKIIRGSARGIDEFNVFSALYYCQDLLGKYGGHKAAGGFSFPAGNLAKFEERLSEFAHQCLEPHHLKPLVKIDTQLNFNQINQELYEQLDQLQPWGINNNEPVFWTPQVRIIEQRNNNNKFTLNLCQEVNGKSYYLYGYISDNINILNVPCLYVDIAYKIKQYTFVNNKKNIELEIIGIRPSYINLSETNMINEKVRIYDLSKELNLKNKDILDICEILNISVKSHSSLLTEEQAQLIRLATNRYKEIFIENQQNKTNLENNELEIESKGEITQLIIPAKNQNQYPDDYLEFEKFVKNKGYSYEDSVLRRVWTQTMNNEARLTILAGSPGSGKTLLVSLLAEFFNRDLENYQSTYLLQPVSPSWFSSESLLGIYSQINHQFYPTEFLRFLEIAEKHQHLQRKFFACLDEFNLAQPEQYLAKILSVMESNDKKIIVCDQEKREVCLNSNLKLFATINTDSASKKLSPKVLDRSIIINVIPLPEKVLEYAKNFGQKDNINLSKIFEELQKNWLEQLLNLGKSAKSSFGYRTIKSVFSYIQYHPYTQDNTVISDEKIKAILDELICSFFLAKLPGLPDWEYNNDYSQQLEEIANNLKQAKLENAQNMINNIRQGYPGESAF